MDNRQARAALLRIKECDLRMDTLWQCDTSVDRGLHVGGAFSALTAMTALYYGGVASFNVEQPTDLRQDIFILSKGHAVAALASVYADLGYLSRSELEHSRGYGARIKGHPGPVIPGVPVATGPLGHGISISCGYALRRMEQGHGNVYCMVGDGELQEGSCWEGAMLAADRKLSNLCVIVDQNYGQSDNTKALIVSMDDVAEKFKGFGFRVMEASADDMQSLLDAFAAFAAAPRGTKPTAIICSSRKGFGGHTGLTGAHKASMSEQAVALELDWQRKNRAEYVRALEGFDAAVLDPMAKELRLQIVRREDGSIADCTRVYGEVAVKRAAPRDKQLRYDEAALPVLKQDGTYNTYQIAKQAMRVFAADPRLYTIDSDLSNASGLYEGTSVTNAPHALNVGIAECNMLCVAEALASEGANVWTSTFSPFFDQRALRRIGVGYQERQEAIADPESWLSEGHNLDITFLATSANLETAVNGATHMGNDDMNAADQLAQLKVIDVGCPQMLLSVMRWIAEGNRGLVYLRTMKTAVSPIYPTDFRFTYAKAYTAFAAEQPRAIVVTSGHGVYEAVSAAKLLADEGVAVRVIDMPSFDEQMCMELTTAGCPVLFAEQNNGAIFNRFSGFVLRNKCKVDPGMIHAVNTAGPDGHLQFIQSGTYRQLVEAFGLDAASLAETIRRL